MPRTLLSLRVASAAAARRTLATSSTSSAGPKRQSSFVRTWLMPKEAW